MTKIKILYPLFVLVFFGSGFYLANLTSFSPAYLAFLIGTIAIILLSTTKKFPNNKLITINLLVFVLIMIVQLSMAIFRRPFVSFLCHLYFILIFWLGNFLSYKQLLKALKYSLYLISFIFITEFLLRIGNEIPTAFHALKSMSDLSFYSLKENSIMFMDTNHVAMVILPFYFLALYLKKEHKINTSLLLILLFIIIPFTYSRAAIIATILFTFLFIFFRINKSFFKLIIVFTLILGLSLDFILQFFAKDPSFLSKFEIFNAVIQYIKEYDWLRLFFGVGYGNSPLYLGIGTHNLLLTYFVEGGILAVILIVILYIMIIRESLKTLYIILPFLFAGLSFAPQVQTFYFAIIAAVILLEKKKYEQ